MRKSAKSELAHLHGEQVRRANEAARADSRRSKAKIDPKDKDAKARIDLAVFTGQDGKAGKLSNLKFTLTISFLNAVSR